MKRWYVGTFCKHNIDLWQKKARGLGRNLKGWHFNLAGVYGNQRKELLIELNELDKKSEISSLTIRERQLKMTCESNL